jgi:2-C-methyl-D-erythritol 4-phosphate cytidylyltransferase
VNIAIIVAAGSGHRLDGQRAKQFLDLCGEPVLVHALRAFEQCGKVEQVILVLPESERESFAARLPVYGLRKIARIVGGGPERQDSVWCGLQQIDLSLTDVVIIHDGVRPLITADQISRVIDKARRAEAAIIAVPVTDTLKEVEGDRVVQTLDRRRYYLVQTPQAFRAGIIIGAHQRARDEGFRATDDAALVERCGMCVSVVEGSWDNLKITWPEDLALAEFLLKRRRQ